MKHDSCVASVQPSWRDRTELFGYFNEFTKKFNETEVLKEMYMDLKTKEKVEEMNSKKLLYALKQYSIANTKTVIQKPKEYFKKCILSAIGQTELSTQYDAYTIEMGAV